MSLLNVFDEFKFKKYVIKLRSKGNTYKSKRQEISELQTEYTNLKRTEEILKQKFEQVKDNLVCYFIYLDSFSESQF